MKSPKEKQCLLASQTVAGIDVGGERKGFHAVSLRGGRYLDRYASDKPDEVANWCVKIQRAHIIAVDAPCCWSSDGGKRRAELKLADLKIKCFWTPSLEAAKRHPKNHYGWMRNGALMYAALRQTHPLASGLPLPAGEACAFETFPHCVTHAFLGKTASARKKRSQRRMLLEKCGIETHHLPNIDCLDAALCALTAYLALGWPEDCTAYGDSLGGFIISPKPGTSADTVKEKMTLLQPNFT